MAYDNERGSSGPHPHDIPLDDIASDRSAISEAIAEIRAVLAEARGLLEAEKDYLKTRIDFTKRQVTKLVVMGVLAIVFALLFAFSLVVGALLILTALLGPLLATIIVGCALIIVTTLLALGCRRAAKDIKLGR